MKQYYLQGKKSDNRPPLSLIICAKNERNNLEKHLPYWLQLDYPNYEIIIVDDRSSDDSLKWLLKQAKLNDRLHVVAIKSEDQKTWKGKRDALWAGIQASKHNLLIFTDADCRPISKHWLSYLADGFGENTGIVLGASPYIPAPTIINQVVQLETSLTALQYLGWAEQGKPYMGVGRNIAYRKSILTKEIFEQSNQSISGDDDLIVQQLVANNEVNYVVNEDAHTVSKAPISIKDWINQKTRHLSSGKFYSKGDKLRLGIFSGLNIALLLVMYAGLLIDHNYIFLFLPFCKALIFKLLNWNKLKLLLAKNLQSSFIISDFLYWHLIVGVYLISIFRPSDGWQKKET